MVETNLIMAAFMAGIIAGYVYGGRDTEKAKRELATLEGDSDGKEFKMVFVVRTDLGMTKGKIAAQCGHAAIACYEMAAKKATEYLRQWKITGQAKIALKGDSQEELLELQDKADKKGLVARVVVDAGRTQIKAGSVTVLGIGPGPADLINEVTGHLKLL